jgi:hypothetical protein
MSRFASRVCDGILLSMSRTFKTVDYDRALDLTVRLVQRFTAVDNSDRSHTRLTTLETRFILPYKYGVLPSLHFKQRGS